MQAEYEAIVEAGFILQLDSPDLGLGRHMMFKGRDDGEYQALASLHVEALNHALRNVPADRVRMHICWGNYEGPHHHDAPMDVVLPIALKPSRRGFCSRILIPDMPMNGQYSPKWIYRKTRF